MGILDTLNYQPGLNKSDSLLSTLSGYTPIAQESYGMSLIPASGMPGASSISSPGWIDKMMGYTDATTGMKSAGWGGMALGAAQGLGNLYMGMQQYGLAKKALQQSKDQFEKNYAAQRTTTNASLEDRQRARVASNAGAYQSVGDYMNQHGIR